MLGFKTFFDAVFARGRLFFFRFVLFFVDGLIVFDLVELAEGGGMFSAFLRDVSGEVRAIGGTVRFHFRDIFRRKPRGRFGVNFRNWFRFFFGFHFVFFEDGASDKGIRIGIGGGFLVLGFSKVGSKSRDLILAQPVFVEMVLGLVRCLRSSFSFDGSFCWDSRFRFTSSLG